MRCILLEPYDGGSHRAFLNGLEHLLRAQGHQVRRLGLPARKWKMRMQTSAPWMAEHLIAMARQGWQADLALCSSFLDLAVLRALLARGRLFPRIALYMHENQFAYPNQAKAPPLHQFTAINFNSVLCADHVAFNSAWNRESFLRGARR